MNAADHKQNLDDFRNLCEDYSVWRTTTVKTLYHDIKGMHGTRHHPDMQRVMAVAQIYNPQEDDILCTELIDRINEAYVNSLKQEQG